MSEKQIKKFRRSIERLAFENYTRAIKLFKKLKRKTWLRHNVPNVYKHTATKRHSSESFLEFKARRKVCNKRRLDRDEMKRHTALGRSRVYYHGI